MIETISKVAVGVLVLAAIATTVRPGSKAPEVIRNTFGGFAGVVNAASH